MTRVDRSAHGLASASCPPGFTSLGTRGVAPTLVGAAGTLLDLFELGHPCRVERISEPALRRRLGGLIRPRRARQARAAGNGVSVSVDLGGRRNSTKKNR